MPTPSIACLVAEATELKILWESEVFQEISGVRYGLFPDNPDLSPSGWKGNDSEDIKSFLTQLAAKPTVDEKVTFVSQNRGTVLPGRKKWKDWVATLWRTARIHERIIAVLTAKQCHPLQIFLADPGHGDSLTWPPGHLYIPLCLDSIAAELFGAHVLGDHDRLYGALRPTVQNLVQRTWSYLTLRLDRAQKRFVTYEQEAIEAFNGKLSRS
jgi:hypothetical protein